MRSRVMTALRGYTALSALIVMIVALLTRSLSWGWVLVVLSTAGVIASSYYLSQRTARLTIADLEGVIKAFDRFNKGALSTRAHSASTREVRQLVDGFNTMAKDAEHAISALSSEEARQNAFISDVSHELRTPLTAIRGAAETLLINDLNPEDQQRFLSTISTEAMRLNRLAEDLLTLRRIEGGTGEIPLRSIDLREAADRVGKMLAPVFLEREVEFRVIGEAPPVLGDIDRIQQVVANLVDNASRMVGPGGRVWVELSSVNRVELGSFVPAKSFVGIDRFAVMSIADNGKGIPEEDLHRIFDRFYRTDKSRNRNRGGVGLGLAIVKAIVHSHGGTIEAFNRPTGGAQFNIYLPIPPSYEQSVEMFGRDYDSDE